MRFKISTFNNEMKFNDKLMYIVAVLNLLVTTKAGK